MAFDAKIGVEPEHSPGQVIGSCREGGNMLSIEIRKATSADLPGVLALYAELEPGPEHVLDLCQAERIWERMGRYPSYALYVATRGSEVIGTFELLIMDNLGHLGAPSGVVEDVIVASRWQGQGVGRSMMRRAMDECRQAGCYKLALSSNLQREAAHRFYESLGFERHGFSFWARLGAPGGPADAEGAPQR